VIHDDQVLSIAGFRRLPLAARIRESGGFVFRLSAEVPAGNDVGGLHAVIANSGYRPGGREGYARGVVVMKGTCAGSE
jgi:hypothetical protein